MMRQAAHAVVLALAAQCAAAQTGAEDGDWLTLFDGRDLTGWTAKIRGHAVGENYAKTFSVQNGRDDGKARPTGSVCSPRPMPLSLIRQCGPQARRVKPRSSLPERRADTGPSGRATRHSAWPAYSRSLK